MKLINNKRMIGTTMLRNNYDVDGSRTMLVDRWKNYLYANDNNEVVELEAEEAEDDEVEVEDLNDFNDSIGDFVISTTTKNNNKKYGGSMDSSMHSLLTTATEEEDDSKSRFSDARDMWLSLSSINDDDDSKKQTITNKYDTTKTKKEEKRSKNSRSDDETTTFLSSSSLNISSNLSTPTGLLPISTTTRSREYTYTSYEFEDDSFVKAIKEKIQTNIEAIKNNESNNELHD